MGFWPPGHVNVGSSISAMYHPGGNVDGGELSLGAEATWKCLYLPL